MGHSTPTSNMDSAVKASLLATLIACASAQWTPECKFVDSFCDPESVQYETWPTTGSTVEDVAAECYAECNTQTTSVGTCEAFTVIQTGARPAKCLLLNEPCVENILDDCIAQDKCVSGPNDCSIPPAACPVVPALAEGFVRWQCVDINYQPINPYGDMPPEGTTCFQTCPSWESADETGAARLQSVCQDDSPWSEAQNWDGAEMAYPLYPDTMSSYPTPETIDVDKALTCGCPALEVKWPYEDPAGAWYDPNTEDAAEFICDNPVEIGVGGEYLIETANTCVLYCDDHYVATAKCLNGAWSGNPEWGFWCYEQPGTGTF